MDFVQNLPVEVSLLIFSWLTHRELCTASLVCSTWNRLAKDPSLWGTIRIDMILRFDKVLELPPVRGARFIRLAEANADQLVAMSRNIPLLELLRIGICKRMEHKEYYVLFHEFRHLKAIILRNAELLTDDMLALALADTPLRSTLTRFGVSRSSRVTDAGVEILCKSLPNLRILMLREAARLTPHSLECIARHLPRLEVLDVRGCPLISTSDIDRILAPSSPRGISSASPSVKSLRTVKHLSTHIKHIPEHSAALCNAASPRLARHRAARWLARTFAITGVPGLDEFVSQPGTIERLVDMLEELPQLHGPDVPFAENMVWLLSNLSYIEKYAMLLVDAGAVPRLLPLLQFRESALVRKDALWTLGNITASDERGRDTVLAAGGLQRIAALVPSDTPEAVAHSPNAANLRMLRALAWTLSLCCHGNPRPPLEAVADAVPPLHRLLNLASHDDEVAGDACEALCAVAETGSAGIDAIICADAARPAIGILWRSVSDSGKKRARGMSTALELMIVLTCGSDEQVQYVVDIGALEVAARLAQEKFRMRPRKLNRIWRIAANLCCGTYEQFMAVDRAGFTELSREMLEYAVAQYNDSTASGHPVAADITDVFSEVSLTVLNAVVMGGKRMLPVGGHPMVTRGCWDLLMKLLLATNEPALARTILHGVTQLLVAGEIDAEASAKSSTNPYAPLIKPYIERAAEMRTMADAGVAAVVSHIQRHINSPVEDKPFHTHPLEMEP